jgi:antitoxin YefM
MNLSDVEGNLRAAIDQLIEDGDAAIISDNGTPAADVMTIGFYKSWMEKMYLLSTPENSAHLAKSMAQLRAGQVERHELIESDLPDGDNDAKPPILG